MAVWTVYLSLCLLVALSASVETDPVGNGRCGVCQEGWSAFGCRCFRFFNDPQTWMNAEKLCWDFDGNLASVHSCEEYNFIQNLIRCETQGRRRREPRTWIGGHDAVQEGVWVWCDGTKMDYQVWVPGEPNNDGNQNCLEMNASNGNWNDVECSHKKPFVCVK